MKRKDDIILTIFFTIVLLIIAKTASLSYDPKIMGMMAILFFVTIIAIAFRSK